MQFNNRSVISKDTTFNVGCAEIIYQRLRCPVIYEIAPFKQSIRVHLLRMRYATNIDNIYTIVFTIGFESVEEKMFPQTVFNRNIFAFPLLTSRNRFPEQVRVKKNRRENHRPTFACVRVATPHN